MEYSKNGRDLSKKVLVLTATLSLLGGVGLIGLVLFLFLVCESKFPESRYRVWDKEGQKFEFDSESDSNQVWNSRPIPSPIPSHKPRDSEFRVWDPHFTYKNCKNCSNFKSETREIVTSIPSPIPRLG